MISSACSFSVSDVSEKQKKIFVQTFHHTELMPIHQSCNKNTIINSQLISNYRMKSFCTAFHETLEELSCK